ncbi:MAG: DUF4836 family protein [Bacteroidetes bacterium]|nr:DUF4836 family protein [Bacteroidota bacterium]
MKPVFKYSLLGAGILAVATASYFLFFSGRTDKLQKYIPEDAAMVLKISPRDLLDGINKDELKKKDAFKDFADDMEKSRDALSVLISRALNDPKETGINWRRPSYMFMRSEKGYAYTAILIPVSDPAQLKTCINDNVKDHEDISLEDDLYFMKSGYKQYWGWNKEALMILTMDGRKHKDLISDHLNLTYENNITSNEEMHEVLKRNAAMAWGMNWKKLSSLLENMRGYLYGGINVLPTNYIGDFIGGTIDFKDGEIVLDAVQKGAKSDINSKPDKKFNTTPDGIVPFFHMSFAVKIKPMFDYFLKNKAGLDEESMMNSEIMAYLKELGNGMSMQMWNQGSPSEENMMNPMLAGTLGMALRVGLAAESPRIDSSMAIFNMGLNNYTQRMLMDGESDSAINSPYLLNKQGNMLNLSYGLKHNESYKIWRDKRLPDDFFEQPFQFWIDFDEEHFPYWIFKNAFGRDQKTMLRNMKQFSHVVGSGNSEKSYLKVVMKDQKKNALAQILEMAMAAGKDESDI